MNIFRFLQNKWVSRKEAKVAARDSAFRISLVKLNNGLNRERDFSFLEEIISSKLSFYALTLAKRYQHAKSEEIISGTMIEKDKTILIQEIISCFSFVYKQLLYVYLADETQLIIYIKAKLDKIDQLVMDINTSRIAKSAKK